MKFRLLVSLFFLFSYWTSLHAEIKIIPERGYFDIVHEELTRARQSVDMSMYLIKLGDDTPQVKTLLDDLWSAQKRGVKVKVVLDEQRDNEEAYQYLKEKISIQFDSSEIKTHAKKILIDGERLIIGSSNWTEAALCKNRECNILVDMDKEEDKVLVLEGESYLKELLVALRSCGQSLDIVMYLFLLEKDSPDDPVYKIVQELSRLHRHGVRIRVILDAWEEEPWGRNETIKFILGLDGLNVYYDEGDIATHSKLVIVDEEKVLLGSANWTRAALEKNVETSLLINSKDIARQFTSYFDSFWENRRKGETKDSDFRLPLYFIKKGGPLNWLAGRGAEYNLRLYLWLIWETFQVNSANLTIQKEKWYDLMSSGKKAVVRDSKRRVMDRCLKQLEQEHLIQLGMDKLIVLNPGRPDLVWSFPQDDYFVIPAELMKYGWFKKMSSRALYGYFINLAEFRSSSIKPYWFDSLPRLSRRYALSQDKIGKGFKELMALNIIEIIHDIPEPGQLYSERKANRYLLNELISEARRQDQWQRLEQKHGELYLKARAWARRINELEDPAAVASLIMFAKIYSEKAVEEVIDKVSEYSFASGRQEIRYISGILQHNYRK